MTILSFKKITLFGLNKEKKEILHQLQKMGVLHLVHSSKEPSFQETTNQEATNNIQVDDLKKAINYLFETPEKAKPKQTLANFNAEDFVSKILNNQRALKEAIDRQDFLQERVRELSPWGNFRLPTQEEVGNYRLWSYRIKSKDKDRISTKYPVQEVYRTPLFIYLVVIASDEPEADAFPEPRIHTGAVSLNSLRQALLDATEQREDLYEERRQLSRVRYLLLKKLNYFTNQASLQSAFEKMEEKDNFFWLQAWAPKNKLASIQKFADAHQLALQLDSPRQGEKPPTLLKTYEFAEGGTELVHFYQMPGYGTFDPSLMMFFSFSLFFAMILADAGYGVLMGIITLLLWKKLGKGETGRWLKPLLVTISILSILYGILLGSYFGVEPSPHTVLGQLQLLNIHNFKAMMQLAIATGCLHILVANALRGWFARLWFQKIQSFSFVLLIIGMMTLGWGFLNHAENLILIIGEILIGLGILLLLAFSSNLPVTNLKSLLKRIAQGLEGVMHISALFGDILSYLRLFALGLAGASLAMTFNHMAFQVAHSTTHHYGWIAAFFILLIGQLLNFALCILSAVIHGLRLNYIEFLKWGIREEGYAYQPFKLKKMEVSNE